MKTLKEVVEILHNYGNVLNQHTLQIDNLKTHKDTHNILLTKLENNQFHFEKTIQQINITVKEGFESIVKKMDDLTTTRDILLGGTNALKWLWPIAVGILAGVITKQF